MRQVTIFHNPRCSKSRETLQLLRARGLQPDIVEYLDTPPTPERISTILDQLGLQPRELMRTNEAEYRELGLDDPALTCQQLIQAMSNHPRLIHQLKAIRERGGQVIVLASVVDQRTGDPTTIAAGTLKLETPERHGNPDASSGVGSDSKRSEPRKR